tara:strand:- start:217 stop:444 length:228 start_codon:yes stop_codon:yes gene_type:complete
MAIDFDALDLVRTKNKAKMYEQKQKDKQKNKHIFLKLVDRLNMLSYGYKKASNEDIKEVYINKGIELIKDCANKI